jgi:hypothetical protein
MNHIRRVTILISCLTYASCDKAQDLAGKATHTLREQMAARMGTGTDLKRDHDLAALVDQTAEGVVFRKDLPFPDQLEVTATRRQGWSGRLHQASALESRTQSLQGTRITIEKLQRAGSEIRHTLEKSGFSTPSPDDPDTMMESGSDPLAATAATGHTHVFRKSGKTWKADPGGGFKSAVLAKDIAPLLDQLLIENALAPRPLWFSSKKRFKPGDELTVTGEALPMLLNGNASGTLNLRLEAFDSVHGHPCAVFAVSGDYRRKDVPAFDGLFTDEEVAIQSGKLWFSLLHPIILKEELDTIQTMHTGSRGVEKSRAQGSVKVSVERQWKTLTP